MPLSKPDSTSRPPAIQFFCKDWMADTSGLTHFEYACYHMMLCAARVQSDDWCSLPDDDRVLARICRANLANFKRAKAMLVPLHWRSVDGRLVNFRLQEEARIQLQRREQATVAGKLSAEARAAGSQRPLNDRLATVPTTAQREANPASALGSKAVEPKSESSLTSSSAVSIETRDEPNPPDREKARTQIQAILGSTSRALSLVRSSPEAKITAVTVADKVSHQTTELKAQAHELADWLFQDRVSQFDVLACVDHFLDHHAEIRSFKAYYRGDTRAKIVLQANAANAKAEHDRIQREDRAACNPSPHGAEA